MTSESLSIRPLAPPDLGAIAAIHVRAFPESALTALGEEALRRYYAWLLTGPHDVTALGAFREERCVGFCVGGTFSGALSGFLRTNRAFLVFRVVTRPWLLASPLVLDRARVAVRILARKRRPRPPDPRAKATSFGVLALAVDPASHRSGAGRLLMDACESAARAGGFAGMDLTVHPHNAPAVAFYERLGWRRDGDPSGWTGVMRKDLVP